MKKSLVIAGAAVMVAAAYTGLSWYVGMKSEDAIRAAVARANDRIGASFGPNLGVLDGKISVDDYRRGIFSSSARYTVQIQDADGTKDIALQDHMQHGPFPWALLKQGDFAPVLAYSRSDLVDTDTVKRWFDAARGVIPVKVDTRIGFRGDGVSTWEFAPLEWAVDNDRLSFSGGRMQVRFHNDFRDSTGEGRFAALVWGDGAEGETITLKDMVLRSQTSEAQDGAIAVHSTFEGGSLVVDDMTDDTLLVENLKATLDSSQKDSLLDAALRYDFGRVRLGDFDLGSISLGGKVARFNFDAFSAVVAEYDAIADEHGADDDEDFELTPQDEQRLLAKLAPALASSPEIALQPVVWRNEKGESTLALSAAFQPLPGATAQPSDANDALEEGLRELRLELMLSRPMVLQAFAQTGSSEAERKQLEMLAAMMFDNYVGGLERDGFLKRDGDRAIATIVYGKGSVNVNGSPMDLNEFLARFGDFM